MFKVEEVKLFKTPAHEVIDKLKEVIDDTFDDESDCLECLQFVLDGVTYALRETVDNTWESEGKYEYNTSEFQLCSYTSDWKIIDKFNIYVKESVSRTGSYYSDWYYSYEKPYIQEIHIETIPEKIIPKHDEVKFVNI